MYRKSRPICLTAPTHERYQSNMDDIAADFLMLEGDRFIKWNNSYATVPENHTFLTTPNNNVPDIYIDCILSQQKYSQFPFFKKVSDFYNVPFISIEHTLPITTWTKKRFIEMSNLTADINIFISDYNKEQWGNPKNSYVIEHCIDHQSFTDMGCERNIDIISVVNNFINRDYFCGYKLWREIIDEARPEYSIFGSTPGLSEPARDVKHLVEEYNKAKIYLNTSLVSPVPTALLEGMACGCVPISTATCMIPDIIVNGVNGFLSNDPQELIEYIDIVRNDEDLRKELSENAKQTIIDRFNKDRFTKNWNAVFDAIM